MKRAMQIIAIVLLSIMGLGFMGIVLKALMNDSPSEPSDSSFVSDSTSEPPDSSFVSDSMSESSDSSSTEEYPNLAFTLLNDDTYSVSAANTKIVTAEIPARYRGKTVTNIATNGFNACKALTTVKIPASIKYISWQAFKDCVNLTTLEFPVEGEIKISSFAFASIGIQELILPGSVSEIDAQAFANCVKLELLEIKDSDAGSRDDKHSLTIIYELYRTVRNRNSGNSHIHRRECFCKYSHCKSSGGRSGVYRGVGGRSERLFAR